VRGEGFRFAYAGGGTGGGCEEAGVLCEEAWLREGCEERGEWCGGLRP
jgi:hypothetical protein